MQTDAWSNIRNYSITNYVIYTPTSVFYKTVHTKEEKHTGIYLASEIKIIFGELGVEKFLEHGFFGKVFVKNIKNMPGATWYLVGC